MSASLYVYSETVKQRLLSGISLLAFVERLALVLRFCVKHPRFDVFLYIAYTYTYGTRLKVIVQSALSH